MQPLPVAAWIYLALSMAAGWWVYADGRSRLGRRRIETVIWALGTIIAPPVFLPIYLLGARPPGDLVTCPHCRMATLSHRAACLHCDSPIDFDAPPAMWGLGEVVGLAIVFIVSLPVVVYALGVGPQVTLVELSVLAVLQNGLFVGLAVYVIRHRYHLPLAALGVRAERWPQMAALGLVLGGATIPLSIAAERAAVWAIGMVTGPENAARMAEAEHARDLLTGILRGPLSTPEALWIAVMVAVLVPVGEEVFFRGLVFGALRRWGVVLAAGLSAFFFAAVHQQVVHFLPIFLLGVILALSYERTGTLVPAMVVHAVNNVVATLSVLFGWNI